MGEDVDVFNMFTSTKTSMPPPPPPLSLLSHTPMLMHHGKPLLSNNVLSLSKQYAKYGVPTMESLINVFWESTSEHPHNDRQQLLQTACSKADIRRGVGSLSGYRQTDRQIRQVQ